MELLFKTRRFARRHAAFAAAASAAVLCAPLAGHAAPIAPTTVNYVFTAGTTVTVDATDTVTGSFTYNTATNVLSNIDVILSGASVYSGTYAYQFTQFTSRSPAELGLSAVGTNNDGGDLLYFGLGGTLGNSSLTLGGFAAYNGPLGNEFASNVTGGIALAPAAANVPEPASLALMAGGLALLGFTRKRRA